MSQPNDAAEMPAESHNQGAPINPDAMPDTREQVSGDIHAESQVIPEQTAHDATWLATGPVQSPQDTGVVATLTPPAHRTFMRIRPLSFVAALALLVGLFLVLIGVELTRTDWATSILIAGITAGISGVLSGLLIGVRSLVSMASRSNPLRRARYAGATVMVALLLMFSGLSYGLQSPIHRIQAHSLEANQQWSAALDEYALAGEAAPVSEDLARVQNEWGESQNKAQKFDSAIATFSIVLLSYTSAKLGVRRAQAGITTAYFGAGMLATSHNQYVQATKWYDVILLQKFCDSTCQAEANRLDATAYYHVAEAALSVRDYNNAIIAFKALTTRFASAPETSTIHADYAKSLLGLGQKQVASSLCSDALVTYQAITKGFSDTASGNQAAIDLLAPQAVTGKFAIQLASGVIAYVDLIVNLKLDAQGLLISAYNIAHAQVKSDGSFTFDAVPLGAYPLEWFTYDSAGNAKTESYYVVKGTSNPYYVANVQPLCPFDFGQITDPIVGPPLAKVTGAPMTLTEALFSAHRLPFGLQSNVLTTMRNVSFALPTLR